MGGIGAQEEIISVIIPVYNVAPYLSRCIKSNIFKSGDHYCRRCVNRW